jgi:hypothetical protein
MHRNIVLIYVIATAAIAVFTTIQEIQPAIFLIDFLAPQPGDKYSLTFVFLVTWLILLLPLLIILLVQKVMRKKSTEVIGSERTGVFVTRQKALQSAVIGIPIYIDSKKVGVVDKGKTKFFDVPIGSFPIQAGKGKQATEKLDAKVMMKDQLNFVFQMRSDGLTVKIDLEEIT